MSEDQPEPISGPIRELNRRIDTLTTEVEMQAAHIKSAIDLYHALLTEIQEIFPRLELVERKTFALSDNPGHKNCPHCGRKLSNPRATKCSICGHEIHA